MFRVSEISVSVSKFHYNIVEISMSKSKFWFRFWLRNFDSDFYFRSGISILASKFRLGHRNSDFGTWFRYQCWNFIAFFSHKNVKTPISIAYRSKSLLTSYMCPIPWPESLLHDLPEQVPPAWPTWASPSWPPTWASPSCMTWPAPEPCPPPLARVHIHEEPHSWDLFKMRINLYGFSFLWLNVK
jgi:hypothetical protein